MGGETFFKPFLSMGFSHEKKILRKKLACCSLLWLPSSGMFPTPEMKGMDGRLDPPLLQVCGEMGANEMHYREEKREDQGHGQRRDRGGQGQEGVM